MRFQTAKTYWLGWNFQGMLLRQGLEQFRGAIFFFTKGCQVDNASKVTPLIPFRFHLLASSFYGVGQYSVFYSQTWVYYQFSIIIKRACHLMVLRPELLGCLYDPQSRFEELWKANTLTIQYETCYVIDHVIESLSSLDDTFTVRNTVSVLTRR